MITALLDRRGTKRTCQSEDCGERFYDLNRETIACPHCHAGFVPPPIVTVTKADYSKRLPYKSFKRPEASQSIAADPQVEAEIVADDAAEQTADDAADDQPDTILEIDDDEASVEDIVDPGETKDEAG